MAIFVMTKTRDGCPAGFFEFKDRRDGYYSWDPLAFHGYSRMAATNASDAERELLAARDEFRREQAAATEQGE